MLSSFLPQEVKQTLSATSVDPTFPTIKHIDPRLPNKETVYGRRLLDHLGNFFPETDINHA